jgi:hypothetical protein
VAAALLLPSLCPDPLFGSSLDRHYVAALLLPSSCPDPLFGSSSDRHKVAAAAAALFSLHVQISYFSLLTFKIFIIINDGFK